MKSKYLTPRQIAEAMRLRNWCEGEAPPKYQKGVAAITDLIEKEKEQINTSTKGTE